MAENQVTISISEALVREAHEAVTTSFSNYELGGNIADRLGVDGLVECLLRLGISTLKGENEIRELIDSRSTRDSVHAN